MSAEPSSSSWSAYWAVTGVPDSGQATHDSIGIEAPNTRFYLPDGAVSGGYSGIETYTLGHNLNASDVKVKASYLTRDGNGNVSFTDTVKANSRKTYHMGDRLRNAKAPTIAECITRGKKIVV